MSGHPQPQYFAAGLFPTFLPCDGAQNPRFLVKSSWQVLGPSPNRRQPQAFDSLLVLDDLVESVLPFTFHDAFEHAIHVTPLGRPGEPWRGIECDLAEATMWILHLNGREERRFRVCVRLPREPATPEPDFPLLGTEFLRDFQLELDYRAFTWSTTPDLNSRVGLLVRG